MFDSNSFPLSNIASSRDPISCFLLTYWLIGYCINDDSSGYYLVYSVFKGPFTNDVTLRENSSYLQLVNNSVNNSECHHQCRPPPFLPQLHLKTYTVLLSRSPDLDSTATPHLLDAGRHQQNTRTLFWNSEHHRASR